MTELLPLNISHLPVRLTLDDYLLLDEHGAFADYRKTELIEGEIFSVNAQHRPHAVVKSRLHVIVAAALARHGQGWEAIVEGSIAMPPHNSPEPDILVTDAPDGTGLVPLDSVKLVIEVGDATLSFDLRRKLPMYARNRVPEYWVFDVNARRILQHWSPSGEAYAERQEVAFGEVLESPTLARLRVETIGL